MRFPNMWSCGNPWETQVPRISTYVNCKKRYCNHCNQVNMGVFSINCRIYSISPTLILSITIYYQRQYSTISSSLFPVFPTKKWGKFGSVRGDRTRAGDHMRQVRESPFWVDSWCFKTPDLYEIYSNITMNTRISYIVLYIYIAYNICSILYIYIA